MTYRFGSPTPSPSASQGQRQRPLTADNKALCSVTRCTKVVRLHLVDPADFPLSSFFTIVSAVLRDVSTSVISGPPYLAIRQFQRASFYEIP